MDSEGSLEERVFLQYLEQSRWPKLLKTRVRSPLDKAILKSGQSPVDFGDFKVGIVQQKKRISWKMVYERLQAYLEVALGGKVTDAVYKDGIGYCIPVNVVLRRISSTIKKQKATTKPKVQWPKRKKYDPTIRDIVVPDIDYSKIMRETGWVAYKARSFSSSLVEEVVKAYKTLNHRWFKHQTGYDKDNIPPKEESPIKRDRHVGNMRYILLNLVREDKPDYKAIMSKIVSDLRAIKEGQRGPLWELYMPTDDGLINIKRLNETLTALINSNDYIKPDIRYEIVP